MNIHCMKKMKKLEEQKKSKELISIKPTTRICAIYPDMISLVICSNEICFEECSRFRLSMSISIIVIYSTIYLMFIESCIY